MKESFNDIIRSGQKVLVDFHAEWCGPCKMMPPILNELKELTEGEVRILKIDVDKNPQVAQKLGIRGVPTLMVFKDGKIKWRQSGVIPAQQLKQVLDGIS